MAVYDDVKGWNADPYIGGGEFYLEYGRFDVSITVPFDYVVAATGTLKNPDDVLTPAQRERLARAKTSDTPIAIIGDEVGTDATRPETVGTQVWRFTADSVRDFAFAAAPNFRWDASGYDGIMIHTFYRPSATRWPEANRMAREAVKYFSEQWMRYPYPQMSSVEGPIEGMEYPMLTFDPAGPSREELQWVVAHEIGHQWSPMVVGVNERLYPWMDEGFNTFIDLANSAKYFSGTALRRLDRGAPAAPLRRPRHRRPGAAADHAAGGEPRPLLDRLPEARAHDAGAALRGARQGGLRPRVPRLPEDLGLQAPDAVRLLPHHARQHRGGARLVLGRLGVWHDPARHRGGGDRQRGEGRHA